jgi:hypothetical protein
MYSATKVGYYWQSIAKLPDRSPSAGYSTFAFTRSRRPRADFYIDTGDQVRNKAIFDALYARREAIEATFGGPLTWERIDDKRASRVACYYDKAVTIHSSAEDLAALRTWAVDTLVRLHEAFERPARDVLETLDAVQHAQGNGVSA